MNIHAPGPFHAGLMQQKKTGHRRSLHSQAECQKNEK